MAGAENNIVDFDKVREMKKTVLVVDVRNPGELKETGKISGSHNVPLPELGEAFNMDSATFKDKYGFQLPEKETQIISNLKGLLLGIFCLILKPFNVIAHYSKVCFFHLGKGVME